MNRRLIQSLRNSLLLPLIALTAQGLAADLSNVVMAEGGFGKDGATAQPMPNEDSMRLASELFQKIKAKEFDGKKSVGTFEFTNVGMSYMVLTTKDLAGSWFKNEKDTFISFNFKLPIMFGGPAASELYAALGVKAATLVGGKVKTIGNLTCSEGMGAMLKKHVTCTISNVSMMAIKDQSLESVMKDLSPADSDKLLKAFGIQ